MKKIAVFAEGLTEQIFIREYLLRVFDPSKISFECVELLSQNLLPKPYNFPNTHAEVFFMIIHVHGDEGVLSAIKKRERNLIEKGHYNFILGLRDMYCGTYDKLAHGSIKENVATKLIRSHSVTINNMTYSNKIELHYSIMEIESWILAMYDLFEKIDPLLTKEYINEKLCVDLFSIDPQVSFYQPSQLLSIILSLCGQSYTKKRSEIEAICSKIEITDIDDAVRNCRCKSFHKFRQAIAK